ncbi:hypothetical protein FQN60_004223 [Etheostoma spectabile]|uniref:Noggin n=1 Tax=Etheostoma spectabile TaxID=54343 RepID=A0A5J5CWJ9_9PERO|nr:hypothetical protein FQN60_004223 [Etheostoma spectabile]
MDQSQQSLAMYLLVLSLGLLMDRGICQHYYLLRPIPSDSLPLVELKEDPDPVFDPKERDLNETELKSFLGDFDSRYLSVLPPTEEKYTGNDDLDDSEVQKPGGVMPKEIRAVDFDAQFGKKHKPSKKLKRRLQQWLWAYSFCPVVYTWTDLGNRFWPRFVRVGSCLSKRSCSVPEGMVCKPANSTHLTILRWRCVQRKGGLKCAWIPVQYPIITDCKCSCSKRSVPANTSCRLEDAGLLMPFVTSELALSVVAQRGDQRPRLSTDLCSPKYPTMLSGAIALQPQKLRLKQPHVSTVTSEHLINTPDIIALCQGAAQTCHRIYLFCEQSNLLMPEQREKKKAYKREEQGVEAAEFGRLQIYHPAVEWKKALLVSVNSEGRRRSSSGVIKVSLEENVTDVEACASEKSKSGTVRHVDSGVVMDGEPGLQLLNPCRQVKMRRLQLQGKEKQENKNVSGISVLDILKHQQQPTR